MKIKELLWESRIIFAVMFGCIILFVLTVVFNNSYDTANAANIGNENIKNVYEADTGTSNNTEIKVELEEEYTYLDIPLSKEYQKYVFQMAEKYAIDANYLFALMHEASSFDVSAKGETSFGLMQISSVHLSNLSERGLNDVMGNPYHNIEAACIIFKDCLYATGGDYLRACAAYKYGITGEKKADTEDFKNNIMTFVNGLKEE